MARSPFQGMYQPGIRPTIVTAPDALVYINGELSVQGCPQCQRRFELGRYITSVQVDLSIESVPGSASINLSIPRHIIDQFYFEGTPIISPMMEVEIFAKGYYVLEGLPQYYPIFWGLVTEVGDSYSAGEHSMTIHCADILKWWEICKMNVNPAFTQSAGQTGRSIYGNTLYGTNPYDMIWTLAMQSMGDVVVGSGSLVSMYKEAAQTKVFSSMMKDIMRYWNYRFSKMRSNLLLYGTQGVAVRGDTLFSLFQTNNRKTAGHFASSAVRTANGSDAGRQMIFDPTDEAVTAYRTQFSQAGQVNFWQSEFQTKLEIANACKEAIGFEFYMDVTGDIVFKPPFYNLDIMANKPISWIQDVDVIDWDLSESESEVVTQLQLQGSYYGNVDYGMPEEVTPYTSVTDYHLLRKYGWRSQTFNSEFLGDPMMMFYVGMDMLDRKNSQRHRGTVSIPLRPELRLGFPIYLAPKDQIWYVQGLSHNIQFGGRAQTSITLTAKREKFLAPKGIGSLTMTSYTGGSGGSKAAATGGTAPAGASGGGAPAGGTGGTTPAPKVEASYSARQLAKYATFKLVASSPTGIAQMPFLSFDEKTVPTDDPYAPVVMRHPKTGRVMGWPNVVMAYSQPFTDVALAATNSGRKGKNTKDPMAGQKKEVDKLGPGTVKEFEEASTALDVDKTYDKHIGNRYAYGITSAGVYVYAHDKSKKIQEMAIISASKLQVETSSGTPPKFSKSAMIRPVSDERGFEVIGHYRYGRGISLRDGSLVLSDGANKRTNIGVQLALSGDLTATLMAQSQGITTITTGYVNPAEAVDRLQPDDLETAAVINPETQKPEYATAKENFVDTAPLGSPANKGLPMSVEATQLSRALTLSEMRALETAMPGGGDAECACIMGRSDLAFLSFGYRVKPLSQEAKDLASFETGGPLVQGTIEQDVKQPLTRATVVSTVETFLAELYTMLDTEHQGYEQLLRGRVNPDDEGKTVAQLHESPVPEPSSLEPPYSAQNRYAVGDPNATLQQYDSASKQITKEWNEFGDELKANTKKAKLQQEIANLQSDIALLRQQVQDMADARSRKPYTVSEDDYESTKAELARKEQELANKSAELGGAPSPEDARKETLTKEISNLNVKLAYYKEQAKALEEQIKNNPSPALLENLERLKTQINNVQKEINTKQKELDELG